MKFIPRDSSYIELLGAEETVVVLNSGGLDSAVVLAAAAEMIGANGGTLYSLTVQYGQVNVVELEVAYNLAEKYNVEEHNVVTVELAKLSSGALVRSVARGVRAVEVSDTYVPGRNAVFLSLAAAWAETVTATRIGMGINKDSVKAFPDCRPQFFEAFLAAYTLGSAHQTYSLTCRPFAPLTYLSKAEVIGLGDSLGVKFEDTVTCHKPISAAVEFPALSTSKSPSACGICEPCMKRRLGFEEAKIPDPTHYHC